MKTTRHTRFSFTIIAALVLTASLLLVNCSSNGGGGDTANNTAPVAEAGPIQNVTTGTLVTLDGSGSGDADSNALTYSWSFTSTPGGSTAALSSSTVVKPTFTADKDGAYVLSLVVNDGTVNSAADTVTITATTGNSAPVANAGPDQNVTTGATVTLNGSGSSDADGDTLTYSWLITSKPTSSSTASLSSSTAVNPTFTADQDGAYVLSLVVNDGTVSSMADTVTITATTGNSAPVANAGPDQSVATGATVTLNGSGSSDADSDTLTYSWLFSSKPTSSSTATLSSATAVNPTLTADQDGAYVLSLVVNDGTVNSAADTVAITASATGGILDATFGTGGKVTTTIGTSYDVAYALGIQTDGKIVAAGYSNNGSNDDFAVARYTTDGVLDTTFGIGGIVSTGIGTSHEEAYAVGIQSDGKILAAGVSYNVANSGLDFALVRWNANGTVDTSFGTNGAVVSAPETTTSAVYDHQAYALGIQSDGKIVAAGTSYNGGNWPFTLVRYNTNGTVDTAFGTNGVVVTDFGNVTNEIHSLGIQSDGKIVAAGFTSSVSGYAFAVARYNTDGSLDATFGTGGKITTTILGGNDCAYALGIQADGKIVVAGQTTGGGNFYFAVVRYNANGGLDSTFGTGGKVMTGIGSGAAVALSLGIQADGKIVAAGYNWTGGSNDFAVVRYNTNGALDTTFGAGGKVTTDIETNSDDQAKALGIQSDGKIVAAGYTGSYDFAVVRYLP